MAYLRRSTDRQERSLDDQATAIRAYATIHGTPLLRTYCDDAISGVRSDTRAGFQKLIKDAQSARCDFDTVMVYDVKRFGRVDNDEAGHYRWLLRQAGVRVVYVAESFGGGALDDLIRPVKQWQAREEARDLAKVTIRGLLSKIKENHSGGCWMGGYPPYGYDLRYETGEGRFRYVVRYERDGSKLLLGAEGEELTRLNRRDAHTISKTDRCKLVLSTSERVEVIRLIFRLCTEKQRGIWQIAGELNAMGIPTARGPEWSPRCTAEWHGVTVQNILRNPVYCGELVWNRRTLGKFYRVSPEGMVERADADLRRTARNGAELWLRAPGAHEAIVGRATWEEAQRVTELRSRPLVDGVPKRRRRSVWRRRPAHLVRN